MAELKKYKPYELYSDTNAVWYKQKPAHWVCERFKYNFREKKKKNATELPAGSISFGEVIFKNENNLSQDTKESYQEVLAGEFLINPLNLNFDLKSLRTALSTINVVVSTGYIVLQDCGLLHSRFARWLLQQFDVSHMKTLGAGVRQTINYADIGNSIFCRPTLKEQKVIAAFLDHETAKIDNLIEKQQQLIELLKEKRQAVISHSVTKGLNPDVPMKESGVEWLGEVPEHWRINSLNHVLESIGDVDHYMPQSVDDGLPYVMTGDLTEFVSGIEFSKCKQVNLRDYLKLSKKIKTCLGDVIMARYATIGTVSYVDIDKDFLVSYSCVTIKPNPSRVLGLYLYYYFKSNSFLQGIQYQVNTNTQGNVGINDLSKIKIVLPSIKEQEEIIAHLQMNLEQLDDLSTKSTQAINLIQERRTALISAAVTGKIDVRDWVAPDIQEAEEPQEATA